MLHSKSSDLSECTLPVRCSERAAPARAVGEKPAQQPRSSTAKINEETSFKKIEIKPNEEIHVTRCVCLGPLLPNSFIEAAELFAPLSEKQLELFIFT